MLVSISGTGRAQPAKSVTSFELDEQLGFKPGTLENTTGVRQRFVSQNESQVDLAVEACKICLQDAGLSPSDIGLLVFGAAVPFQPIPTTAPLVMRGLGIADGAIAAFDVNSTCLSFLSAFETAALHIAAGRCKNALVVSSEIASRALPWDTDPEVAALFGDGAAAVVLRKVDPGQGAVRANLMRTFPSAYEACSIGAGGTRFDLRKEQDAFFRHATFNMDGKALFRISSKHFSRFVSDLLEIANWRYEDIDIVIPHQASPFALDHMARQIGIGREKLVDISRDYGNQIAASIPFTLDIARKQGLIHPGSKVLFLGTSAGVSFGGMALEA